MRFKKTRHYFAFLGSILLFIGGGICYGYVYRPLQLARAHTPDVEYSIKALFISPLCLLIGAGLLAMAILFPEEKWKDIQAKSGSPQPAKVTWTAKHILITILVVAVFVGPPILLYLWFKNEMSQLGYTITF